MVQLQVLTRHGHLAQLTLQARRELIQKAAKWTADSLEVLHRSTAREA